MREFEGRRSAERMRCTDFQGRLDTDAKYVLLLHRLSTGHVHFTPGTHSIRLKVWRVRGAGGGGWGQDVFRLKKETRAGL